MVEVKPVLNENVNERVKAEPRKVQLSASLVVEELSVDETDEKELTIFVNSKRTVLFGGGL